MRPPLYWWPCLCMALYISDNILDADTLIYLFLIFDFKLCALWVYTFIGLSTALSVINLLIRL